MRASILVLTGLLCIVGCADESHQAPVSTARSNAGAPGNSEPQPANSLPRGAAVDAPLTTGVGNVGTTRVAPVR